VARHVDTAAKQQGDRVRSHAQRREYKVAH
jgi:hypothetical protein